ncbi:hypothetical protein L6164_033392 [Bauhinia variegata]|nr:hypothetical protein L6164_033392 [Bauhinia variegata]
MVAHVSDFGIAKLLDKEQSKTHTKTLGTFGYIAPEYGTKGLVSAKGDVYSYGIMLMEVFTRKKPNDDMFVEGLNLKSWVTKSMPNAITKVMDSNMLLGEGEQHIGEITRSVLLILELALNCCTDQPEERINMTDVIASLNKINIMFMKR